MRPASPEEIEAIIAARIAEFERRIYPEALTARDVGQRLGLKSSRVNELIQKGLLPSYTIGGARRVDPQVLAEFIADRQRRVAPPLPAPPKVQATGRDWLEEFKAEAYGEK